MPPACKSRWLNENRVSMPKLNPNSWPLAVKLSFTITVVVATVGFLIGAVMVIHEWSRAHEALGDRALLLSRSIATTAPKAILRKDFWELYMSLRNLQAGALEIESAMILDANGKVLAHLHPANTPAPSDFAPDAGVPEPCHLHRVSWPTGFRALRTAGFSGSNRGPRSPCAVSPSARWWLWTWRAAKPCRQGPHAHATIRALPLPRRS